jgi:Flp pilus assembly protein TadB
MKNVVGIFASPSAAERAVARLVEIGVPRSRIRQLTPSTSERQIHTVIPIAETEQPGMGKAIGGLLGFVVAATLALGVIGVLRGGLGQLSLVVLLGAATLGACGAVAGAFAGGALENKMSTGLPKDEIYFYEEALRAGHSVVFAFAASDAQEEAALRALKEAGAESLDAGDESWRVGLSSPGDVHQRAQGRRTG